MGWGLAGRGLGGGGGVTATWRRRGGAVVEVLQLQLIDKVVDVLMQLKFQQSRVCTGSSSTECWTYQLRTERSRGSNPLAPDSVHPLSGEHSCCATDFHSAVLGHGGDMPVVATTGAVLVVVWEVVDMPVNVQRQVPCF